MLPPAVELLPFVKTIYILSNRLYVQSTCLSTLQAQSPRLPGWERDSRRQRFFSNMSDTLETSTRRRVSHHCCGTDQHLQAAGGGLGWFFLFFFFLHNVVTFGISQLQFDIKATFCLWQKEKTENIMTNWPQNAQEMATNHVEETMEPWHCKFGWNRYWIG